MSIAKAGQINPLSDQPHTNVNEHATNSQLQASETMPLNGESTLQENTELGNESRRERIAVAAYYQAERRGFAENGELDDWFEAERQMDSKN
jgi:hypothetical protein